MDKPKSRSEALKIGANRYFTGNPCKHGHISERQSVSGNCIECFASTHHDIRASYDKGRIDAKINKRKRVNDQSRVSAKKSGQEWTQEDVELATVKGDNGDYIYTVTELISMLGRSLRSIERCRNRYRNHDG